MCVKCVGFNLDVSLRRHVCNWWLTVIHTPSVTTASNVRGLLLGEAVAASVLKDSQQGVVPWLKVWTKGWQFSVKTYDVTKYRKPRTRTRPLGRRKQRKRHVSWEDSFKLDLQKIGPGGVGAPWTGLIWLRIGTGANSREHGNEPWGFIKCGEFVDEVRNC